MKIKVILLIATLCAAVTLPAKVYAASPSVYASASKSSVSVGSTFTVTMGVTSNGEQYDTLQATLNYNSSRVSYVSHALSSGSIFATEQNNTGSSFKFKGAYLGGTSSNKSFVTVTFKAKSSGSASFSLSGVAVLNGGSSYGSVGASGSTVSIASTSSGDSSSNEEDSGTSSGGGGSFTPAPAGDTTPPAIKGNVNSEVTQSTITLTFKSDENAKSKVTYQLDKQKAKSVSSDKLTKEHKVELGKDSPLEPGQTYKITISLTDKNDNSAKAKTLQVRTTGVEYGVKIIDQNGQPLVNHPVELHSDPIQSTTDSNGVAEFTDVTPGEHTLVFDIDGVTFRKPVLVAQTVSAADDDGVANNEVSLPVTFAQTTDTPDPQTIIKTNWFSVLLAAIGGAVIASLVNVPRIKKLFKSIKKRSRKYVHTPHIITPNKHKK